MIRHTIITGPQAEPVSLSEVKKWLQLDDIASDDGLIVGLIAAARQNIEAETGVFMMEQTIEEYWDMLPDYRLIELNFGPVQSVTSVKYLDNAGAVQTFASSNYTVDTANPARVVLNPSSSWPSLGLFPSALIVRYVVGYDSADLVPNDLKAALLLKVRFLYDNREDMAMKDNNTPTLRSAGWLQSRHRTISI